jgi:hypothetical protein
LCFPSPVHTFLFSLLPPSAHPLFLNPKKPTIMRSTSFITLALCALSTAVSAAPTPQLGGLLGAITNSNLGSITNPQAGNGNEATGNGVRPLELYIAYFSDNMNRTEMEMVTPQVYVCPFPRDQEYC